MRSGRYVSAVTTTTARRTQAERSAATRRLLLDATVDCLVEFGYTGTTTAAVAERAGLSRGAQLHHFGTRQRLIAAAVQHLADRRLDQVQERARRWVDDGARPRRALGLLAEALSGPLYAASLELWVAARVDPELREALIPVEQHTSATLRRFCRDFVTEDPVLVQMTLDLMLGRGVGSLLMPVPRDRERAVLDTWTDLLSRTRP